MDFDTAYQMVKENFAKDKSLGNWNLEQWNDEIVAIAKAIVAKEPHHESNIDEDPLIIKEIYDKIDQNKH